MRAVALALGASGARGAREGQHQIHIDAAAFGIRAGRGAGRTEAAVGIVTAQALQRRTQGVELQDAVGEARMVEGEWPPRDRVDPTVLRRIQQDTQQLATHEARRAGDERGALLRLRRLLLWGSHLRSPD